MKFKNKDWNKFYSYRKVIGFFLDIDYIMHWIFIEIWELL